MNAGNISEKTSNQAHINISLAGVSSFLAAQPLRTDDFGSKDIKRGPTDER